MREVLLHIFEYATTRPQSRQFGCFNQPVKALQLPLHAATECQERTIELRTHRGAEAAPKERARIRRERGEALAKQLDETGHFPHETFRKAAELGLTGVTTPEAEGGAGFDHVAYTIVIEEISRCCASTSVILAGQNSL
jgi:alkylation response protein AidB-like acyl-CoA dehydrogenase